MPNSSRIMMDAGPPPARPDPTPSPSPPPPSPAALAPPQPEPPPTVEEPELPGTGEPEPAPAPVAVTTPPELPKEAQERIDRLTREKYEAQRRATEYENQWRESERQRQEMLRQAQGQTGPDPIQQAREQGRIDAETARNIQDFNDRCDGLFAKGRDEFGAGMDDARAALNAVGWGSRPDALAALIQLPDGHRVYRKLAGNLDNAARILRLPPMGIAMELARMSENIPALATDGSRMIEGSPAAAPGAPMTVRQETSDNLPHVSRAPEPLRAVGGTNTRAPLNLYDKKVPVADWIRQRDKTERRSRIMR